ncbi:glycoside hydrolase family 108 protein [Novosphingobium sp.]|uniref:glycoside hydrolase family 108 protein n=1 Tax=Novosphingobium sp. TaxID=1874826 RepID=UPI003B524350
MSGHDFIDALVVVVHEEGGYVDDARDPGGATNLGVTARTWMSWSGKPASETVMRGLTPGKVGPLYRAWYWDKVGGDALPVALALAVFDFAVNAGPAAAIRVLQGIVGAPVDGQCGQTTARAIDTYASRIGLAKLIDRFSAARRDFYRQRTEFPVFGKGWLARVDRIEGVALSWVG